MRHPLLTFVFERFRAVPLPHGYWQRVVDESRYTEAVGKGWELGDSVHA